jgi:hypothetical protein
VRFLIIYRLELHPDYRSFAADIQSKLKMYGCNIRTLKAILVRGEETLVKQRLCDKIGHLSLSTIQQMLESGSEVTEHTSHSIVQTSCRRQPKRGGAGYFQSDITERSISSPAVFGALFERHGRLLFSERSTLLTVFRNVPQTASAAGWMWEGRCHRSFCIGGAFTLFPMRIQGKSLTLARRQKPEVISIDPLDTSTFDSVVPTCSPDKYYIPMAKNHPTFDACFLLSYGRQLALQMTLSLSHSINSKGFDILERMRPTACDKQALVFVIPKENTQDFKCPKPTGDAQESFKYYILPLEPDESKYFPSSTDI